MKLYKLTDQMARTRVGERNELTWGPGVTHTAKGSGTRLCSPDVIHAYTSPLVAVFMNPGHANLVDPILWEAEGEVVAGDSTKVGVKTLTTVKPLDMPKVTTEQRVRFAILCVLEVCDDADWRAWAKGWLSGEDRTAAAPAAREAAAEWAARAAALAADAAGCAAAGWADWAAEAAGWAAADAAGCAAAGWADWAALERRRLDLDAIAQKAMEDEK